MKNKMEYMLIPQKGDQEIISKAVAEFSKLDKRGLVDYYNKQSKLGILGARRQSLTLFALGLVFMKVFGESPVYLEDNVVLGMKGQIHLADSKFILLESFSSN